MNYDALTPTQQLIIELLIARQLRLYEDKLAFSTRLVPTLRLLEYGRWVYLYEGVVESTVRVSLTPGAISALGYSDKTAFYLGKHIK